MKAGKLSRAGWKGLGAPNSAAPAPNGAPRAQTSSERIPGGPPPQARVQSARPLTFSSMMAEPASKICIPSASARIIFSSVPQTQPGTSTDETLAAAGAGCIYTHNTARTQQTCMEPSSNMPHQRHNKHAWSQARTCHTKDTTNMHGAKLEHATPKTQQTCMEPSSNMPRQISTPPPAT